MKEVEAMGDEGAEYGKYSGSDGGASASLEDALMKQPNQYCVEPVLGGGGGKKVASAKQPSGSVGSSSVVGGAGGGGGGTASKKKAETKTKTKPKPKADSGGGGNTGTGKANKSKASAGGGGDGGDTAKKTKASADGGDTAKKTKAKKTKKVMGSGGSRGGAKAGGGKRGRSQWRNGTLTWRRRKRSHLMRRRWHSSPTMKTLAGPRRNSGRRGGLVPRASQLYRAPLPPRG